MSLPPTSSGLAASPVRTTVSDHPLGSLTSSMSGGHITNSTSSSGLSLSSPAHINHVYHPLSPLSSSRPINNSGLPLPLPMISSMSSSTLSQLPLFATAAGQATAAGATVAPTNTAIDNMQPEPMSIGDATMDGSGMGSNERVISETDRLVAELSRLFGGTIPPSRTVPSATHDVRGLQTLAEAGCWREVVKLGEELLGVADREASSATTTPTLPPDVVLRIHFYVAAAHTRLRRFKAASSAITRAGPFFASDKFYESFPKLYPTRRGNMVPFNMHLLRAELNHFQGQTRQCLELLAELLAYVNTQMATVRPYSDAKDKNSAVPPISPPSTVEYSTWRERAKIVQLRMASFHLHEPDYATAIKILLDLHVEWPSDRSILTSLGRIYLQYGDVNAAELVFQHVAALARQAAPPSDTLIDDVDVNLNRALLLMARCDYAAALEQFSGLVKRSPSNDILLNNFAVCALYTNKVADAVSLFEDLIRVDPYRNLREVVVSNLRVLYELSSSDAALKKRLIDGLLLNYAADDCETAPSTTS